MLVARIRAPQCSPVTAPELQIDLPDGGTLHPADREPCSASLPWRRVPGPAEHRTVVLGVPDGVDGLGVEAGVRCVTVPSGWPMPSRTTDPTPLLQCAALMIRRCFRAVITEKPVEQ